MSTEIGKYQTKNASITKRTLAIKLKLNSIRQHLNQESSNTKELHKREYYDRMLQQKLKKNDEERDSNECKLDIQLGKVDDEIDTLKQQIELFTERKEKEIEQLKQQIEFFTERKEKEIEQVKKKKTYLEQKYETKAEALETDITIQNYMREIQRCDEQLSKERPKKLIEIQLENELVMLTSQKTMNDTEVTTIIQNMNDLELIEQKWDRERKQEEAERKWKLREAERHEQQICSTTKAALLPPVPHAPRSTHSDDCESDTTSQSETATVYCARRAKESEQELQEAHQAVERMNAEHEEMEQRIAVLKQQERMNEQRLNEQAAELKSQAIERLTRKKKELLAQADNETDQKKRYNLKYDARTLNIKDFY